MPYKRDTMLRNDDIASSAPSAHLPWATRPHHSEVADIAGTCPRPRTLSWQHEHVDASLDVRDINAYRTFRSQRLTDPQRPTFAVHGRVVTDDDAGMFVTRARGAADHPDFSLTTADIEGAEVPRQKEFTVGGIKPADRRHFRVTNFIGDIAGTSPGSRKKGLTTLRGTDAQERDYVLLDGRTLDAQELTVGKSWYNAAATLISASAAEAASASATAPLARTSLASGVSPYVSYAKRVLDPVAAEVAKLRGEVHALRGERDLATMRLQATTRGVPNDAMKDALPPPAGNSLWQPAAASTTAAVQQHQPPLHEAGGILPTSSRLPSAYGAAYEGGGAVTLRTSAPAAGLTPREPGTVLTGGSGATHWVQRARWGGAADATIDPIAALRSSAASASVRDLLGVLPAPRQDYLNATNGSTTRATTGVFDRTLDSAPAAPRPGPSHAQVAGAVAATRANFSAAQGTAVHARAVARSEGRAVAAEVMEVRALPP